jgi:alpha-beta hydrolase superfamily lysophospholipase
MSDPITAGQNAYSGEGRIQGSGEVQLFFRWVRPDRPRGVLVVVHGLGEHSGRYQALAEALVAGNFTYYSYDLRGHGQSDGPRGDVHRFNDYSEDLDAFLRMVRGREERLPIFLMGHSMGGIVAVLYALNHQAELAGLIAASTAFQLVSPPAPWSLLGSRLLSAVAPGLKLQNDLHPDQLSNDPGVAARYLADPLVQRRVTVQWANEFFGNYHQAIERAGELLLPVLVLHGGSDRIAEIAGARAFLERVSSADKTLHVYPNLRHELYNELPEYRSRVFSDLIAWLAKHSEVP